MSDTARIYQLMVLSAWADGKVEPSEALAIHEIASADPRFAGLVGKTGIAQEMKGRIDKLGLEGALREAASWITQREDRELAFRCCARVLRADQDLAAQEAEVLATLQELFALSGDDVKRLLVGVG